MENFLVKNNLEIGVLGLWHLGSVYSASLAKLGFNVTGWDENQALLKDLKKGKPPLEEPLLEETVKKYLDKNLTYTTKPQEAMVDKDYLFITYDVPVDEKDQVDLSIIERTFTTINEYLSPNTTIVVSSQVPIGTCKHYLAKLQKKEPTTNVIYFPENLRLGKAFETFLKPDRVVIGSNNKEVLERFENDFSALSCPFIKIGLESAEMVKHALNSYLAMMISFSSEISDLAELFGANMNEVVTALKTETRISKFAPLNPGLGFAGGTLGRDVQTLKRLGKTAKYPTSLLSAVYEVNQNRLPHLVKKLSSLSNNFKNTTVGVLGLTYKPNTNTLRRSMSLELATLLNDQGVRVKAFDPSIKKTISSYEFIEIYTSLNKLLKDVNLLVLMTEWEDFKNIDWKIVSKDITIFDCKNYFNKDNIEKQGLNYYGIGYPL